MYCSRHQRMPGGKSSRPERALMAGDLELRRQEDRLHGRIQYRWHTDLLRSRVEQWYQHDGGQGGERHAAILADVSLAEISHAHPRCQQPRCVRPSPMSGMGGKRTFQTEAPTLAILPRTPA